MLSYQTNENGSSSLNFNTKTGKFEVVINPNGKKRIMKAYYFYKHAVRVLFKYRKKYKLNY